MFKWPMISAGLEIFTWPSNTTQKKINCRLDDSGELLGLDSLQELQGSVCLHLPPGHCLLRQLTITGLSTKEINSALMLWAEESLPDTIDNYILDSWIISPDIRGLVAIPRVMVDKAREKIIVAGGTLGLVQVPELLPPTDAQSSVLFWETPKNLLACFWNQQVLYDWQSFPPGSPSLAIFEQADAMCKTAPTSLHRYSSKASSDKSWNEIHTIWPHAESITTEPFEQFEQQSLQDVGPEFLSYVHESENQPLTGADKVRLSLTIAATFLAGLFLFHSDISYRERHVEKLRHHVSLLKIKANRSEKLAARSGKTLRQVRELRAMTIERKGVMKVLQTLSESLPPRVKVEAISVERNGAITLDGIAETEVDISTFLERLRISPLITDLSLSFSQKDTQKQGDKALVRFRLEARWTSPLLTLPETKPSVPRTPRTANQPIQT